MLNEIKIRQMLTCICRFTSRPVMCCLSILQSTGDNHTLHDSSAWKANKWWLCRRLISSFNHRHATLWYVHPAVKRVYGTDEGQTVQDCHPALDHPTAAAINSAVITNNGICQRSVSYLNGRFDNRVYQWKWLVRSLPRQGYTRVFEVRVPQEQ